jgi:hypothetical protein
MVFLLPATEEWQRHPAAAILRLEGASTRVF